MTSGNSNHPYSLGPIWDNIATEILSINDLKLLEKYFAHEYMKPRYAEVIRKISRIVSKHELAGNSGSST